MPKPRTSMSATIYNRFRPLFEHLIGQMKLTNEAIIHRLNPEDYGYNVKTCQNRLSESLLFAIAYLPEEDAKNYAELRARLKFSVVTTAEGQQDIIARVDAASNLNTRRAMAYLTEKKTLAINHLQTSIESAPRKTAEAEAEILQQIKDYVADKSRISFAKREITVSEKLNADITSILIVAPEMFVFEPAQDCIVIVRKE